MMNTHDRRPGDAETAQEQAINLTPEMLAGVPPKLLQELDETTLVLNEEAILEVIKHSEARAPDTAGQLRALVQDFQIERIRELLQEVEDRRLNLRA